MAGSRQYRRNKSGQFAGAGSPGTKITVGRAGGFANAAHRARVAQSKSASKHQNTLSSSKTVKVAAAGVGAAAAIGVTRAVVGGRGTPARRSVEVSNPGKAGNALTGVVRAVGKAGKALK